MRTQSCHDCLSLKMNVIQTGFTITYSFSLYAVFASDFKINGNIVFEEYCPPVPSAEVSPGRARPPRKGLVAETGWSLVGSPSPVGPGLAPGHSPGSRAVCSSPGDRHRWDEATAGAQPATHDVATCSATAGLGFQSEIGARASLPQRAVLRMKGVTA